LKPIDFAAACIYSGSYKDIDFDHFISTIQTITLLDGYAIKVLQRIDGEFLTLTMGSLHVKLDFGRKPLAMEGFKNPLMSPYLLSQKQDFQSILESHQQNILVTIGAGDGVTAGRDETHVQVEYRLKLLHRITTYLAERSTPDVIHWTQSELLLSGAEYLTLKNDELPLLLVLHPFLIQGKQENEVQALIIGAEQLIEKSLKINSVALDPASMVEIATIFVNYCQQIKSVPADGETVGRPEEWVVRVNHAADQNAPFGKVELTVLSHKSLPVTPEPEPTSEPEPTQASVRGHAKPALDLGLTPEERLKNALRVGSDEKSSEGSGLSQKLAMIFGNKWVKFSALFIALLIITMIVLAIL
jgi:hypothetical protein